MKIFEKVGVPLNALSPRLIESKNFKGGSLLASKFLQSIPPKMRNHILNYAVGIEIEVENAGAQAIRGWRVERDGSLRNDGIEYKTNYGTRIYQTWESLSKLQTTFAAARAIDNSFYLFSERCSVHVHLDVRNLTY